MCAYCGCRQRSTIVELTADHEAIGAVADRLAADHDALDTAFPAALQVLGDDAWSRLDAHGTVAAG